VRIGGGKEIRVVKFVHGDAYALFGVMGWRRSLGELETWFGNYR
jgi:hypothetical protein